MTLKNDNTVLALLYHAGGVGDFITILPAIRLWRRHHPQTRLIFLGQRATGHLGLKAGYVDDVLDLDRARFSSLFDPGLTAEATEFFRPFDTTILFAATHSPLVTAAKNAAVAHLFYQPPFPPDRQHAIHYHLGLFSAYDAPPPPYPVISVKADKKNLSPETSLIVLHHGSGSGIKNWPRDRFFKLARRLRRHKRLLYWIQGPADTPAPASSADQVFQGDDLWATARLLAKADLYVGNDSGITHLAAAVGCPTLAIFGPSDPEVWAPLGPKVYVVSAPQACAPCHMRPQISASVQKDCHRQCLAAITIGQVHQQALNLLGEPL